MWLKFMALPVALALPLLWAGAGAAQQNGGEAPISAAGEPAVAPEPQPERLRAVINNFRPYGYLDEAGRPTGMGVDILDAIARRAGFEVEYTVRANVSDAIEAVEYGLAAIHPALADVPARRAVLAFSDPYDTLRVVMFRPVRSKDPSSGPIFDGLRLGFNRGSIGERATRALTNVTPVPLESNDDLLLALAEGRIDGVVTPKRAFERLARAFELEGKYRVAGEPLLEIDLRIAVDRDRVELLETINETLATLKTEPAWQTIRNRWFPPRPPYWDAERILVAAAIVIGLLVIGAAAVVFREREMARNRLLRESRERFEVERALAAQQAEANQLLTRHNRDMQSILYVVSHDLKSPLVSIGGFARKAEKAIAREDQEAAFQALDRVRSNVETMGSLIAGILQLSRIGRERLAPSPIDWPQLIKGLNGALAADLEARGARIEVVSELPPVIADPTLFYRMVQNLVANALKHGCPEPGMTVEIRGATHGDWHRIAVADSGPGIPAEYHERIFGLFQRLDRGKDGSGIGLATVLNIAERHGGHVSVDSTPGAGATFWVTLPVSPTVLPSAPADSGEDADRAILQQTEAGARAGQAA
ncbi:MAG: transporter substrate-binding domain-containing protein [Pseudomonadota bacterium]